MLSTICILYFFFQSNNAHACVSIWGVCISCGYFPYIISKNISILDHIMIYYSSSFSLYILDYTIAIDRVLDKATALTKICIIDFDENLLQKNDVLIDGVSAIRRGCVFYLSERLPQGHVGVSQFSQLIKHVLFLLGHLGRHICESISI